MHGQAVYYLMNPAGNVGSKQAVQFLSSTNSILGSPSMYQSTQIKQYHNRGW